MSQVLFISDPHLGHKKIMEFTANSPGAFRGNGTTVEEHDEWVIQQCLSMNPNKHTVWYIMGDVCMSYDVDTLKQFDRLPGKKILIMGNHDDFPSSDYLRHFDVIRGTVKKYGFWISHEPMHESELWGLKNLHGHSHLNQLRDDPRYRNCCIEWLPDNRPVTLDWVRRNWLS